MPSHSRALMDVLMGKKGGRKKEHRTEGRKEEYRKVENTGNKRHK